MKKDIIIFLTMSVMYVFIEVFVTAIFGEMVSYYGTKQISMIGFSSVYMCVIGGFLGCLLGKFNEINFIKCNINLFFQSVIGMIIITLFELISGYILNIKLGFRLWDYSEYPINFIGQISLFRSILWFLICPLVFWFDDSIRSIFLNKTIKESLWSFYKKTFKFQKIS